MYAWFYIPFFLCLFLVGKDPAATATRLFLQLQLMTSKTTAAAMPNPAFSACEHNIIKRRNCQYPICSCPNFCAKCINEGNEAEISFPTFLIFPAATAFPKAGRRTFPQARYALSAAGPAAS